MNSQRTIAVIALCIMCAALSGTVVYQLKTEECNRRCNDLEKHISTVNSGASEANAKLATFQYRYDMLEARCKRAEAGWASENARAERVIALAQGWIRQPLPPTTPIPFQSRDMDSYETTRSNDLLEREIRRRERNDSDRRFGIWP